MKFKTVLALAAASLMVSPAAYGADGVWSPDRGPSLFQTFGIDLAGGAAVSRLVPLGSAGLHFSASRPGAATLPLASARISIAPQDLPVQDMLVKRAAEDLKQDAPPVSTQVSAGGALDQMEKAAMPDVSVPSGPLTKWADILGSYATQDAAGLVRFDYAGLKASAEDMTALGEYIDGLSALSPSAMGADEAMAYWANLYNALTVQIVAQNFPVKSIREIKSGVFTPGPWKKKLIRVEGKDLTLDNIEHDIMRPTYKTPMVHYMVNCASLGCPNLKPSPWHAKTLKADQDKAARAFINSPRGARIDEGKITVSSIYKWFKEDFGGNEAGVIAHLKTYADQDLKAALESAGEIDKYDYDWGVNAP